jgi:hypothetical protein
MKKYLIQFFLFIALLGSVIYLIPSKEITYKNKVYSFTNLPSLNKKAENLNFDLTNLEDHYQYTIESTVNIDDSKEWSKDTARDQKTLERRIESLIGNNYEVRLDNKDNKILFNVYTLENLGRNAQILSISNADLKISAKQTTLATLDDTGAGNADTETKDIDLNFTRKDFGIAEINITSGTQGDELQVRLPIGLIGPEKIKEINNRAVSSLNIKIGDSPYTGKFVINQDTGSITHLAISPVSSLEDARALKALLNTGNYNLVYNVTSSKSVKNHIGTAKLAILSMIFLVGAVIVNKLTLNNLSNKKLLSIIGIFIVGLAFTKLVGVTITNGYILVLTATILLTIFSSRYLYYIFIIGLIFLTKLFGYLYYIDLKWSQIILLTILALAIWSTNYLKKFNKYV